MPDSPNHPEAVAVDILRLARHYVNDPHDTCDPHEARKLAAALLASVRETGELRELLRKARGYVEEPGEPGTGVVTTEESAIRSKVLLAAIDAALKVQP